MKAPILSLLATVAIHGFAPVLPAQTLTVDLQTAFGQPTGVFENTTFQGNPVTNPTVAFGVTVTLIDGIPVINPVTSIGFCIELDQHAETGLVLTYQAAPLVSALLPNAALRAAHLSWLMDNHAPAIGPENWPSSTLLPLSLAMQLAVWEVVSDTDLSLNGPGTGFRAGAQSDSMLANAVALAENWLNGLSVAGIDSGYVSQKYVVNALTHPDKQDLIYLTNIPEPSSLLLVATCSLAFIRRRRR